MSDHSSSNGLNKAYVGLIILGLVTLLEVFFSLLSKGDIISSLEGKDWAFYVGAFIIAVFSFYKAYYIISHFMHLGSEVKSFAMSVLLPACLLVWLVIAFLWAGDSWGYNRERDNVIIIDQAMEPINPSRLELDTAEFPELDKGAMNGEEHNAENHFNVKKEEVQH